LAETSRKIEYVSQVPEQQKQLLRYLLATGVKLDQNVHGQLGPVPNLAL